MSNHEVERKGFIVPKSLNTEAINSIQWIEKETQTHFERGMLREQECSFKQELEEKMNDHFERIEKRLATFEERDKELGEKMGSLERKVSELTLRFTRVYGKKV